MSIKKFYTPLAGTGNSEVVLVMKKTSREATHSIPNPTHFKSSPVLSATEHWVSALWTSSVLVIV
jgi:hypothetical protein